MANTNMNIDPPPPTQPPRVPSNDPPGVLPLFHFFLRVMNELLRGVIHESPLVDRAEAVGFASTGIILSGANTAEYSALVNRESLGRGPGTPPEATPRECILLHVLWLNHVVPKALQHAHIHARHRLATGTPGDMVVDPHGPMHVVRIVLALLDFSLRVALDTPWLRAMVYADADEDDVVEFHANHYERVFGELTEPIETYQLRFRRDENTNV